MAEGWIVPGLVDAHCHIGLDENGAVDEATTEEQAIADRDAGALLLRDCGSAADTRWVHERDDLPRLIRAGRHIARTKRYIRNFAHEVEPDELASYAAQEAQRGDGWVKLVGDWIDRETGDLEPSFPAEAFAAAIAAAHEHGAKVTAHCFGEAVLPGLIARRHRLHRARHRALHRPRRGDGRRGGRRWCRPCMQLNNFPDYADAAEREVPGLRRPHATTSTSAGATRSWRRTRRGWRSTPAPTPAGCCPHGQVAGEVRELAEYGFTPEDALGAASWRAREWLGLDGHLSEGTSADFVVYDRNPLEDLSVLAEPKRIVLRGPGRWLTRPLVDALRSAGSVFAEDEAEVLRAEARTRGHLELMLARRVRGEPLEQVVGWAEFCGLRVAVAPGVFVPRRRSELLVDLAVAHLRDRSGPVVVDLCCGTGALGAGRGGPRRPGGPARRRPRPRCGRGREAQPGRRAGARGRPVRRAAGLARRPRRRARRERALRPHRRDRADAPRGSRPRAPRRARRWCRRARRAPAGGRRRPPVVARRVACCSSRPAGARRRARWRPVPRRA